ncbi:MAG: GDP-mannose 4,6-dehydratase [Candidatus Krumholzibacteria bacterium]|jgi:nucleoside-diphosphate-sugar epimerase|nr:GDP-mannose 4,6-dehydratase [Candidatus Krumholzibacteria bacterium]
MSCLDWNGLRGTLPAAVAELLAPGTPVVVTGCAGFIGSHLCEALLALDCRILGIDSLTDYYAPAQKRANLEDCLADPRFTFLVQDLNDCDLAAALAGRRVCFHLAAQAGVRASWGQEFTRYLDWNVLATQRLLEVCRQPAVARDLARVVYSSSSSVYGDQPRYPVSEDDLPAPRSPYGVSKLAAEHLCSLYSASYGVPTSSLRYFTVYGPRQRPDMAFRKFSEAALDGRPFTVYGDGRQTRDFTFVADAVRANLLAAVVPTVAGVFNIGGGARVSLQAALDLLVAALAAAVPAAAAPIAHGEAARGDVRHTYADCERARRVLGWQPAHDLAAGLAQQVAWTVARRTQHDA